MTESFASLALRAQADTMTRELARCNERTETYGLRLSEGQMQSLLLARAEALRDTGRVEPGGGVLPRIIDAFCDSPYIMRDTYAQTIAFLQDLFYALKNEIENAMTDDELIEALARVYNGRAQGSLEFLEDLTVGDLYRALTHRASDCEDDADDTGEDWMEGDPDD